MLPLTMDVLNIKSVTPALVSTIVFITVVFVAKFLWSRRWLYYYAYNVPGKPAWPIIGNALDFSGTAEDFMLHVNYLADRFNGFAKFWYFTELCYLICDPKDLQIVLNETLNKHDVHKSLHPLMGKGILTANVDQWKKNRKIVRPTFNRKILEGHVDAFADHCKTLVKILDKKVGKEDFDIFPVVLRCTFDTICETHLGVHVDTQNKTPEIVDWLSSCMEIAAFRMFKAWYQIDFLWNCTSTSKIMNEKGKKFQSFIKEKVFQKREEIQHEQDLRCDDTDDSVGKPFINSLIRENAHLTDEEIVDEAATITVAGSDTSATTIGFVLLALGLFPEIQEKAAKEVQTVLGISGRSITNEDLTNMPYLERVMKETLRVFPVVPMVLRTIYKDVSLEHYTLPAGSSFSAGIWHLHRNPEIWHEPLKFDPDRFLPEEVAKRHPFAFIPFLTGPRNCIGSQYAMLSMKVIIADLIRHFKFTTPYKTVEDVRLKAAIATKVVGGYMVALEKRNL